jgi:hypothetical protein
MVKTIRKKEFKFRVSALAKLMAESDGFNWDAKTVMETPQGETPQEFRAYWREKARIAFKYLER